MAQVNRGAGTSWWPPAGTFSWPRTLVWREPEGEIRFVGLVTVANERDGLSFNDWIPVDAPSHVVLEQVLAARRGGFVPPASGSPRGVGRR